MPKLAQLETIFYQLRHRIKHKQHTWSTYSPKMEQLAQLETIFYQLRHRIKHKQHTWSTYSPKMEQQTKIGQKQHYVQQIPAHYYISSLVNSQAIHATSICNMQIWLGKAWEVWSRAVPSGRQMADTQAGGWCPCNKES